MEDMSVSCLFFPFFLFFFSLWKGKARAVPCHPTNGISWGARLSCKSPPCPPSCGAATKPIGHSIVEGSCPHGYNQRGQWKAGGEREKFCRDRRVGREERLAGSGRRNWLFFLPLFFLLLGEKGRNVRMIREIFANASGEGALFSDSQSTSA